MRTTPVGRAASSTSSPPRVNARSLNVPGPSACTKSVPGGASGFAAPLSKGTFSSLRTVPASSLKTSRTLMAGAGAGRITTERRASPAPPEVTI